jgi:DNA invertase Pin-like site-specific DNA recombinase
MIQERVRAGLARAKDEGKRLGRPPISPKLEAAIRAALIKKDRPGVRKIAGRTPKRPAEGLCPAAGAPPGATSIGAP